MIDPITEATTLRLILSHLEDDVTGSVDAISRILTEVDGDDAALDIVLTLLTLLCHEIDCGNRRPSWIAYIQHRLAPTTDLPDTIPDFEGERP